MATAGSEVEDDAIRDVRIAFASFDRVEARGSLAKFPVIDLVLYGRFL